MRINEVQKVGKNGQFELRHVSTPLSPVAAGAAPHRPNFVEQRILELALLINAGVERVSIASPLKSATDSFDHALGPKCSLPYGLPLGRRRGSKVVKD